MTDKLFDDLSNSFFTVLFHSKQIATQMYVKREERREREKREREPFHGREHRTDKEKKKERYLY